MVTIDFSDTTDEIIDQAVTFSKLSDAEVIILHVCPPLEKLMERALSAQNSDGLAKFRPSFLTVPRYDIVRDEVAHELRHEHQLLLEQVNRLKEQNISTRGILTHGKLVPTIIREVNELEVDVIVIGSHCHGTVHKLFSGSVRDTLLKELEIPIFIVPVKHESHHKQFKRWKA